MPTNQAPQLQGDAADAVAYRGGHLQIIASAGSGKTEVVSQRVASLLAEVPPEAIVAFTFTERAAASLKSRIERRVAAGLGKSFLDKLNGMFVGTIHSYCFRVLQQHVPRYETFDVLDDHRLTAFLTRHYNGLGIKQLDGTLFRSIRTFSKNLQVVENELLTLSDLEDPFREIYEKYLGLLEEHRFLTYGQMIARCVQELSTPTVFDETHGSLRQLIVDEYQDINPAQERLIESLAVPPVQLCVVGDDDQSIYQWRGSDVSNILGFVDRHKPVKTFQIETNRRSRPRIIAAANHFAGSIQDRLPKVMRTHRPSAEQEEIVCWSADTEADQARVIARAARSFHDDHGYQYRDIAVLCRGRVSFPVIVQALESEGVPVQPGGRTNLFLQPDADLFARTLCWLVDHEWRPSQYGGNGEKLTDDELVERYQGLYDLSPAQVKAVRAQLEDWKSRVPSTGSPANLVRDFYDLLGRLGIEQWDLGRAWMVNRLGTLARCSQVLADYETARRRTRPDHERPGEMRGGQDRGEWYYRWLAIYVQNWAQGAYEDFEGEEDVELDAVDLTTVHQAKGLEWPIVFVPSLTQRRFPASGNGSKPNWHVPDKAFSRARYEGSVNDERRLFYVAMTRARDYLSLCTFDRIAKAQSPSIFLSTVASMVGSNLPALALLPEPPPPELTEDGQEVLEVTFSDLAAYLECGLSFRLRRLVGFQPPLVPEIGYGKAVHHVLRRVADHVRASGKVPTAKQLERLFDDDFYMPAANAAAYRELKTQARRLVDRYLDEWQSELHRVWAVERPFELHLGHATVAGRADVIITEANGGPAHLSIVDYKTAADSHDEHNFQLQVYTDAGRREGLLVDGAFVHDLRNAQRTAVPVGEESIGLAEKRVETLVQDMRDRNFTARPGAPCARCDVRAMCRYRAVPN